MKKLLREALVFLYIIVATLILSLGGSLPPINPQQTPLNTSTLSTPPTQTPSPAPTNVTWIATNTPIPFPTQRPTPTFDPDDPTPTLEAYRGAHQACAVMTRDLFDDPVHGCSVIQNNNFTQGVTIVAGQPIPSGWRVTQRNGGIPFDCGTGICRLDLRGPAGTALARTELVQDVRDLENGQCYLLKIVADHRVRSTVQGRVYPENELYATASINNQDLPMRLFEQRDPWSGRNNQPNPADANFIRGVREFVWAVRGGTSPNGVIRLGIQANHFSFQEGSYVLLLRADLMAAPEGYCSNGVDGVFN